MRIEEQMALARKQCLERTFGILKSYETVGGVRQEPTDASGTVGIGHRGKCFCKLSFGVGGHGSENIDMRHRYYYEMC